MSRKLLGSENFEYHDYERKEGKSWKKERETCSRKITLARASGLMLEVGTGHMGPGPRFIIRRKWDPTWKILASMFSKWYSLLLGYNKALVQQLDYS